MTRHPPEDERLLLIVELMSTEALKTSEIEGEILDRDSVNPPCAGNYASITGAPPATARRDLGELVALGAMVRIGQLRGTRYWLAFVARSGVNEQSQA